MTEEMEHVTAFLRERKKSGMLRQLVPIERLGQGRIRPLTASDGSVFVDFSSNDYLALAEHPAVVAGSRQQLEAYGAGAGAARLMSGSLEIHQLLEKKMAQLEGKEAALLFGSGYLANIGVLSALTGREDVIFTDRLNHASIYDGCRLSGTRIIRFRHNDLNHLEDLLKKNRGLYKQALIIVESIYSMDGDRSPLRELVALKSRYHGVLAVDEAHAVGIFGSNGGGVIEEDGIGEGVDITIGTFGKALGSYGAFVAASQRMIDYLINQARTFVYSTALPPPVIGASLAAVNLLQTEAGMRSELRQKAGLFKKYLQKGGVADELGPSQIVPILVGDSLLAVKIADELKKHHIFATAIRPPTVPQGTARLRFSITRHHREEDLQKTAQILTTLVMKQRAKNQL